jgi:hypothetical protein
MKHHATNAAGTDALIAGIDARLIEINETATALMEEMRGMDQKINIVIRQMKALQQEAASLEALKRKYTGDNRRKSGRKRSEDNGDAGDTKDPRSGATDTVLSFLAAAPNHRMPRVEAIDRLEGAIRAGAVRTTTTDAAKMASTTIGNMVRNGHLTFDGTFVALAER